MPASSFDVTGAAASHWADGDYGAYAFHIVVSFVFAGLVIVSWALRPQARTIGTLFPAETQARKPATKGAN